MGDVLSQNEIDNLLAALSTGELDAEQIQDDTEKAIKNYDFKRPSKFSKEHLRTLEIIFEHYGRLISTNLPVYLRKNTQVSVASSETVMFSEFSNALTNPIILGIVDFAPLNGNMLIEISSNLGWVMIDRMLGGYGLPLERNREFSEIEMTIIEKVMTVCTQLLREPWKNVEDINPVLERVETNPQFAQIISPSDMVAIVTLNVKIGDSEGFMNLCLPYFTLEDIMDRLNTKYWYANMQKMRDENYESHIEALIERVSVPVKAILGRSTISVSDFADLQIGDVIRLDTQLDSELNVYVGNLKKFTAMPGSNKDRYAVRVTTVLREGE